MVYKWLFLNKLSLYIKNTILMLFHPYQGCIEYISCFQNKWKRDGKSGRIWLSWSNSRWTCELESTNWSISNTIIKIFWHSKQAKNHLPPYILRTLHCSLVQSHLSYAILTRGYSCNRLEELQKRLIRMISRSKYNAHTEQLLKQLELLKLSDLPELSVLKFYFKYLHTWNTT